MDVPDRGPQLLVVSWTLLVLSFILMAFRLYCKFMRHRGLWWDDHVLVASWVAGLVSGILLTVNVDAGFGKHRDDIPVANLVPIGKRGTVLGIVMVLGVAWSKTSFALTLLRLINGRGKTALWVIIVSTNVFLTTSGVTNLVQCSPVERVWNPTVPGICWPSEVNVIISTFAGAYSALVDIVLVIVPWYLIWNLQMKKREKFGVAIAMSMGIFASITAIIKSVKLQALASADFFYDGGDLAMWAQAEICTTIMAASIPVLRALGREVSSSAGRYYTRSYDRTRRYTRTTDNIGTKTTDKRLPTNRQPYDAASDKSILGGTEIEGTVHISEILVEYGATNNSAEYRMDTLSSRGSPV